MAARTPFAKAVSGPIVCFAMIGQTYMDAVITPNRSLSERGVIVLIAVVTIANCCSAAVFLAMGATLVPIFLAIDVAVYVEKDDAELCCLEPDAVVK